MSTPPKGRACEKWYLFSRLQVNDVVTAKGRGGVWVARADGVAACGEDMAARTNKKKNQDVGAHTGGVVEDSSTPRPPSYFRTRPSAWRMGMEVGGKVGPCR